MRLMNIYASDDGYLQVEPTYLDNGEINYITIYSGKQRQNRIFVQLQDNGKQIDDLIQILLKYYAIIKENNQHS